MNRDHAVSSNISHLVRSFGYDSIGKILEVEHRRTGNVFHFYKVEYEVCAGLIRIASGLEREGLSFDEFLQVKIFDQCRHDKSLYKKIR